MAPPPSTRDSILAYLERETSATSTELAGHLGVTRQAINLHIPGADRCGRHRQDRCRLEVRLEAGRLKFEVSEVGVGVFRSIADRFQLPDETAAMIELIKGKTTTMPEATCSSPRPGSERARL